MAQYAEWQRSQVLSMGRHRLTRKMTLYLYIESLRILYKTYIRPNLEVGLHTWSPYLDKTIEVMGKIQIRATQLIQRLIHFK